MWGHLSVPEPAGPGTLGAPLGRPLRLGIGAALCLAAILAVALMRVPAAPSVGGASADTAESSVQEIYSELIPGRFPAITVKAGTPVRWTFHAEEGTINGCNARLIVPGLGLELSFQPGDNVLEFTADTPGTIPYSCWMGMIRSTITVEE